MVVSRSNAIAGIEALFAVPLAYFLPSSATALVLTAAILFVLNASVVTAAGGARLISLHLLNSAACGIGLGLALFPWLAFPVSAAGIVFLCCLLMVLGFVQLPSRMSKVRLSVQATALAAVFLAWMTIHRGGLLSAARPADHLQVGLRFLFSAPLVLVAVASFSEPLRGSRYLPVLVAACAAQLSAGLFELGAALERFPLIVAGFAFLGVSVVLFIFAGVPYRTRRE